MSTVLIVEAGYQDCHEAIGFASPFFAARNSPPEGHGVKIRPLPAC